MMGYSDNILDGKNYHILWENALSLIITFAWMSLRVPYRVLTCFTTFMVIPIRSFTHSVYIVKGLQK